MSLWAQQSLLTLSEELDHSTLGAGTDASTQQVLVYIHSKSGEVNFMYHILSQEKPNSLYIFARMAVRYVYIIHISIALNQTDSQVPLELPGKNSLYHAKWQKFHWHSSVHDDIGDNFSFASSEGYVPEQGPTELTPSCRSVKKFS